MRNRCVIMVIALTAFCFAACSSRIETEPPVFTETTAVSTTTATETANTTETIANIETTTTVSPTFSPTDSSTTGKTAVKASTITATQAVATTEDWKKNYRYLQLFADTEFKNGFSVINQVTQKSEGIWENTLTDEPTSWMLAQWGAYKSYTDRSGYLSLLHDNKSTVDTVLDNGLNRVEYHPKTHSMTLAINTIPFFGGLGHTDGSTWPHLLMEQLMLNRNKLKKMSGDEYLLHTCDLDKLILTLDIRMTAFRHVFIEGINAFQVGLNLYIESINDNGFTWFGVRIFDDRGYSSTEKPNFLLDTVSKNFIYRVPFVEVYNSTDPYGRYDFLDENGNPAASDEWMCIEIDLMPFIKSLADKALQGKSHEIYPATTSLDSLFISGMNIGYEVHGSYDVSCEFKNLTLTAYKAK